MPVEEGTVTFQVHVDRSSGGKLGVHFDRKALYVEQVAGDGLIAKWNRGHPAQAVREGDRIVKVNAKSLAVEGAAALGIELKDAASLDMTLVRELPGAPFVWSVRLKAGPGAALGAQVDGQSMQVVALGEKGLLVDWNAANPGAAIRPGDKLLAVGAKSLARGGTDLLRQELHSEQTLELRVLRKTATTFQIKLNKGDGELLGVQFHKQTLQIEGFSGQGVLPTWNTANPSQAVWLGDQIVQVNSKHIADCGAVELVNELRETKGVFRLKFARDTSGSMIALSPAVPKLSPEEQKALAEQERKRDEILGVMDSSQQDFFRSLLQLREPPAAGPPRVAGAGGRSVFACPCCGRLFHVVLVGGRYHAVVAGDELEHARVEFQLPGS